MKSCIWDPENKTNNNINDTNNYNDAITRLLLNSLWNMGHPYSLFVVLLSFFLFDFQWDRASVSFSSYYCTGFYDWKPLQKVPCPGLSGKNIKALWLEGKNTRTSSRRENTTTTGNSFSAQDAFENEVKNMMREKITRTELDNTPLLEKKLMNSSTSCGTSYFVENPKRVTDHHM